MSERERSTHGPSPDPKPADPREERLRSLYHAAFPPLDGRVPPSRALQQRVVEITARQDARAERLPRRWQLPWWDASPAAAALAAACVIAAGLALLRWAHGLSHRADVRIAAGIDTGLLPRKREIRTTGGKVFAAKARTGEPRLRAARQDAAPPPSRFRGEKSDRSVSRPSTHLRERERDDLAFLNGGLAADRGWVPLPADEWARIEAGVRRSVRVRDDFVRIPFPRVASASSAQLVAAVEAYRHEAAVIDPRLFRKVTLHLKGVSLEELCAELTAQTGVSLHAGRGVSDEKATLLLEDRPAREVMRAVARLFGYRWARSGTEGAYRYALAQDLKSQLVEEELRNRDRDAALLALDAEMAAYQPYLDQSPDQLASRAAQGSGPVKQRLARIAGARWGALQLYHRLTAAERAALASGQSLSFSGDSAAPDRRLPAEWRKPILDAWSEEFGGIRVAGEQVTVGVLDGISPADYEGAYPIVTLRISRSELGELSLQGTVGYELIDKNDGGRSSCTLTQDLATGRSPSVARPDNAAANRALRAQPLFQRQVSLRPQPSCPRFARKAGSGTDEARSDADPTDPGEAEAPHVTTADVWEEVHRRTGLPIVADFYTHLYPVSAVTLQNAPLFDALCQVGDGMGVRWRMDGDFLLGRSSGYFWDKLKEVPNRLLRRWQQDRVQHGGLPLEDLLEMATLPDQQLDSAIVGKAIRHCWGLEEWAIFDRQRLGAWDQGLVRPYARFLAGLQPGQRERALQPAGLAIASLPPVQQQEFLRVNLDSLPEGERSLSPGVLQGLLESHLRVDYVPAGWYIWCPRSQQGGVTEMLTVPRAADRTAAGALAAARRLDPAAHDVRRSPGILLFTGPTGNGRFFSAGLPPPAVRP